MTLTSTTTEMVRVAVDPDGVPFALRRRPQWVVWKAKPKKDDDGFDKVPYNSHSGKKASTTDLLTWSSFEEAVASYHRNGWDGIGYVLSSGDSYTFIDLDDCRNPETGEIKDWAQAWMERFDGYTEISPSGTGLHVIVRGKTPHNGKTTLQGKKVEIYSTERFTTITGVRP